MALSAKYYFAAQVKFGGNEIPVYAFTGGDEYERGWESNLAKTFPALKQVVERADGARGLTIAVPRILLAYFTPNVSKYDRLTIFAADGSHGRYGSFNHTITFADVFALSVKPILGWKGLPAPQSEFRNHWEKKIRREFYAPVAVTLASGDTTIV